MAKKTKIKFKTKTIGTRPANTGTKPAARKSGNKSGNTGADKRARKADPVVTEIVRNGVIAVTEEMKTNLMRTAYNIIIYEALDFTTGLFTPEGETISIGIGLPMFIRGMAETVKAKIRHFGAAEIRPGDIYVTNDSYLTGSHLNHVTLTLPIFHRGKLVAFSCCMAHWLDIGGILGGMSTDIYSEGLQLPILKYQDRGMINQTVVDIIKQNVRLPSRAMGDLRAQVTRSRPASGASSNCSSATAATPCWTPSARSWITPRPWRAPAPAPSPTASTRPNPTWTTTASTLAGRCRSRCGSWSRATR